MSSRSRVSGAALAGVVAVALMAPAAAKPLVICAEPDNLPFSHRDGRGFEIEAAHIVARDLGRPLEVVWGVQRAFGYLRVTINAGVCDAMMSMPQGFKLLTVTEPWYTSRFMFVSRQAFAPAGFDNPQMEKWRVAIPSVGHGSGTPPAIALAQRALVPSIRLYSIFEPAAQIHAVSRGEVDLAVVWGPFAAWYAPLENVPLVLSPIQESDGDPPFVFRLGVGVRHRDAELREAINGALARSRTELAEILHRWRVPTVD